MSETRIELPDVIVNPNAGPKPLPGFNQGQVLSPDRSSLLGEAYRRGILPDNLKAPYEEALKRGLIPGQQPAGGQPQQPLPGGQAPAAAPTPDFGLEERRRQMSHPVTENLPGGRAAGVDYNVGTGFAERMALQQAGNPKDAKLYLDKTYGAENVFRDPGGRWFVKTPEGKFIAPEGGSLGGQAASWLAAEAPTIAGATMGGALGSAVPGAGTVGGAAAGAAVGGAMGRTATELFKTMVGRSATSLGEKAQDIGTTGVTMAAGEGLGRMVTGLPALAGRVFREKLAGVTPEGRQMASGIARLGGAAPLRSVAPGLASPVQKQDISSRLGADWLRERNEQVVSRRLREITDSLGIPQAEREAIMDPTAAIPSREAGETVQRAVQQKVGVMEGEVAAQTQKAQRSLDTQLANINRRMALSPPGKLGEDAAAALAQSRQEFSEHWGRVYGQIEPLVAGQPVVPTGQIARAAKDLLEAMPKTGKGQVIFEEPRVLDSARKLMELAPSITISDAQRIRSMLGQWGLSPDLAGSLPIHEYNQLKNAINLAFDTAAANPVVAPAIKLMRQADKGYHEGIRKFENLAINKIVKDVRDGIVPNPEFVANTILREGQLQQAQQFKRMVPPALWQRIAGADWQAITKAARDPQTGEIMTRKLASEIQEREQSGLLDLTYGPAARDMRLYSQRLAAFDSKIPPQMLAPGSFGTTMRVMEAKQAQLDAYMKDNYLAALAKPSKMQDDAISWIVRPGDEQRLIQAQREFGEASPQMKAIRLQALKELLHSAVIPTERGVSTTISGPGIEGALAKFTPRQQDILFPDGLAGDMRYLGKQIRAMFPALHDQLGGALIAGKIRNMYLPRRLWNVAYYEGMSWIYSHPTTVRALTQGLQRGSLKDVTRETIRGIFRAAADGTLPRNVDVQDPAINPMPKVADQPKAPDPAVRRQVYDANRRGDIPKMQELMGAAR